MDEGTVTISSVPRTLPWAGRRGAWRGQRVSDRQSFARGICHVAIGASSTVPVVLTNDLSKKLTLTAAKQQGNEFSMSGASFPLTLDAGKSVTLNVTFTPESPGTDGGSLFISGPR